jgi:hypothetical protein
MKYTAKQFHSDSETCDIFSINFLIITTTNETIL